MTDSEEIYVADDVPAPIVALWAKEAEEALLGAVFCDVQGVVYPEVSKIVQTPDFYAPAHRTLWAVVAALVRRGMPTDIVSVHDAIVSKGQAAWLEGNGGLAWLNAMAQFVPRMSSCKRYAQIIHDRAQLRAVIALADKLRSDAMSGTPVSDVIGAASAGLSLLARGQTTREPQKLGDLMLARTAHYEQIERGEVTQGQPLGFPTLAKWIGGFVDGCLYFLGARPGVGKSALSLQMMLECARRGEPWLFLSQEMPAKQVADRAISHLGRVSRSAVRSGKMGQEDWGRVMEAVEFGQAMPAYIDDQPALTIDDIRAKAASIPGLRGLVVDYLQLCSGLAKKSKTSGGNRNSEIEEISRGLKQLAKELNMPVIALSQLNRSVETRADKRPMLSDLRDSGSIEQDADGIFFLYMAEESQKNEDGDKTECDLLGFVNAKARDGQTGEFFVEFDGKFQTMRESMREPSKAPTKKFNGGMN